MSGVSDIARTHIEMEKLEYNSVELGPLFISQYCVSTQNRIFTKTCLVILQLHATQLILRVDGENYGSGQELEERFRPRHQLMIMLKAY
jgi:hypothetical protein